MEPYISIEFLVYIIVVILKEVYESEVGYLRGKRRARMIELYLRVKLSGGMGLWTCHKSDA